jgi:hypothetical protein
LNSSGLKIQIINMTMIVTPPITLGTTYAAMISLDCPELPELGVEVEPGVETDVELGDKPDFKLNSDILRGQNTVNNLTRGSRRSNSSNPITNQRRTRNS